MFKSIRSRLALSFAAIALVAATALGVVLLAILLSYYSNQELDYLQGNAKFVAGFVNDMKSNNVAHDEAQSRIENLAFLTQTRIQVYGSDQQLLYDSGPPESTGIDLGATGKYWLSTSSGNVHAEPQRIGTIPKPATAPSAGGDSATDNARFVVRIGNNMPANASVPAPPSLSATLRQGIIIYRSIQAGGSLFGFKLDVGSPPAGARSNLAVVEPIKDPQNGANVGSIKLSQGPAYGGAILASVARGWALASAFAVLLAAAVGWYISRRISAPALALNAVTTRMAQGDLSSRADAKGRDEFGQLARSFNEMADRVEETVIALRRFVADATHELNTPLTALRTNLELITTEPKPDAKSSYAERALTLVDRLSALTSELLVLSRLDANEVQGEPADVDLVVLTREISELYASRAEQANVSFSLELPPAAIVIRGHRDQLGRALGNLLDNAIKFTPQGGDIRVGLRPGLRPDGTTVELSVEDSGPGIPDDDLPHIFDRFHRGRNAAAYPGSGLGLAIAKTIVERHHGTIVASNTPGGARFWITLPVGSFAA